MTMKEGRKGGGEEGRREGRRHKKLRGNKFIQPFFPPRPSVWPVFWCKASSESRGETGERCPEIGRKTPNCSFSFLPLQRSKLREALEATHHKSSSSSSTAAAVAAAKSCLNLCEKLKPLGKLFVFFFLRQKLRL